MIILSQQSITEISLKIQHVQNSRFCRAHQHTSQPTQQPRPISNADLVSLRYRCIRSPLLRRISKLRILRKKLVHCNSSGKESLCYAYLLIREIIFKGMIKRFHNSSFISALIFPQAIVSIDDRQKQCCDGCSKSCAPSGYVFWCILLLEEKWTCEVAKAVSHEYSGTRETSLRIACGVRDLKTHQNSVSATK